MRRLIVDVALYMSSVFVRKYCLLQSLGGFNPLFSGAGDSKHYDILGILAKGRCIVYPLI